MRIHHLNCATFCPLGGHLLGRAGARPWEPSPLVCHTLLIEGNEGLVLVDTGLGLADLRSPYRRLGPAFVASMRPRLDEAETARRQLERLGFSARDVRDIVLTHLDLDHAGGLSDFPEARVHVHATELEAARQRLTLWEKARYRPMQWRHQPRWVRHVSVGEPWFGFESVRALSAAQPEVLMVPLHGHTRGHTAVAVRTGEGWLLHCGDAYFHRDEMEQPPRCPPGLVAMQRINDTDHRQRVINQNRLRALKHSHAGELTLFCAHDPEELARLQAAAETEGAGGERGRYLAPRAGGE